MAVTSTLSVVAFDARDEARDQRREAEGLVGFMLGDLREKLEPLGRLDALDSVGARALGYYEQQDKSALSDEALAQRSRALTLMGEIANTRGDLDGALRPLSRGAGQHGRAIAPRPRQSASACSTMRRTSSGSAISPGSAARPREARDRVPRV